MIVSDSSPLIYLSRAGRLRLLRDLYGQVLAPEGVAGQVMEEGRPEVAHLRQAARERWLGFQTTQPGHEAESQGIGTVDAQILSLAEERKAPLVTNDRALFYAAKARGIKVKWFILIAEEAVRGGILSADEAERLLTDMIGAGLRVRSQVLAQLLIRIKRSGAAPTDAARDHDAIQP